MLPALGRNFHPEVALGRHKRRPVHGCPVSRGENETRNEDGGGTYTSPRSPGGLPGGNDTWWLLFSHPVTSDSLQLNNKHLGRISNDVHRQEGVLPAEGIAQRRSSGGSPWHLQFPSAPFVREPAGRPQTQVQQPWGGEALKGWKQSAGCWLRGISESQKVTPPNAWQGFK